MGTAVLAGLYLALRISEMASMRWDGFDLERYTVTGKEDYTATLPVHPRLRDFSSRLNPVTCTPFPVNADGPMSLSPRFGAG
ncbi:MAG TPA: hypothetical protein VJ935_02600 [Acidimicrobiia bacterium]|nr:hypothetical protein [Acidimicrobiia bacterium]